MCAWYSCYYIMPTLSMYPPLPPATPCHPLPVAPTRGARRRGAYTMHRRGRGGPPLRAPPDKPSRIEFSAVGGFCARSAGEISQRGTRRWTPLWHCFCESKKLDGAPHPALHTLCCTMLSRYSRLLVVSRIHGQLRSDSDEGETGHRVLDLSWPDRVCVLIILHN